MFASAMRLWRFSLLVREQMSSDDNAALPERGLLWT
jgi:hypothetical protein